LMHKIFHLPCEKVVDHIDSFKLMYKLLPNIVLQWIGRTRSKGLKGVGYLSFLLRDKPNLKKVPDGFFVTAYDREMRQRECLGNTKAWDKYLERKLIDDVIHKAKTSSRLTGGQFLSIPVTHYSITYLYKDKSQKFIRGWHAILKDSLYLPDVFLENTYNNGKWFKPQDREWKKGNTFHLKYTFDMLHRKTKKISGWRGNKTRKKYSRKSKYQLFYSKVIHKKI